MAIEEELKSRLSEDFLENIIFLTELLEKYTSFAEQRLRLPKDVNEREQHIYKQYVIQKLAYEGFLKAKPQDKELPNFNETFNKIETNYLRFKQIIEAYNKEFKRSLPLWG